MANASDGSFDSGSFRDRQGRVYLQDGRVLRGMKTSALEAFRSLEKTRFYQAALADGSLVGSREIEPGNNPLPGEEQGRWDGFIEHDRVPVISYAYEWTFSMLQAAAELQLTLLEAALLEDFTMKDATPYNIQFVGGKPVFIDIPSFEPLTPGRPWVGYRQFCEMYLFPLLLQCYKDIDFQPFLRADIDGVGVQLANRIFGFRDRFRKGVTSHIWLQSKLESRYSKSDRVVKTDLKAAGFNKEMILANVRKLRKLVSGLSWAHGETEWVNYAEFHNYSAEDHEQKANFVDSWLAKEPVGTLWDVGSNQGQFSRIAAKHCEQVISLDVDHPCLDQLYRHEDTPANILPLLQNVLDPSPSWGWRNQERSELAARAAPDLLLCLAVIHHVVITGHVPVSEYVDWMAELAPATIIEFVERSDDKVQTLLRNKDDDYADYDLEPFERELQRRFEIVEKLSLGSGNRHLYYAKRKA